MKKLHYHFNNALTGLILLVVIYILVWPWLPNIGWQFRDINADKHIEQSLQKIEVPDGHRLIIPGLDLDQEIYEGPSEYTLMKGPWHRPGTSEPIKGGNTVIAGHRFMYSTQPAIFYHLDKIKMNDKLYVAWDNKLYTYEVNDIFTVMPNETWIEDSNSEPMLTLYTCTPLWTSKQRLVVRAQLESVREGI